MLWAAWTATTPGVVKVYEVITGRLLKTLRNPKPESFRFGEFVAISGTRVVVAAPFD